MNYGYTRPTSAARLCQLARVGDLTTLRTCIFSAYQLNKLVSWAILDLNGPPTYLGTYNALMIAASYRQFEVVKYFVEEKKANLSIKGGRSHHLTSKDCASMSSWFFKDVDERIVNYLNQPPITYGASLHTFMACPSPRKPTAIETTFEWELVVKPAEQFSL